MNLLNLKHRLQRWLKRLFRKPRYFVATMGEMGLEVEFFYSAKDYDAAVEEAEEEHDNDNLDTFTYGDIE